MPNTHPSLDGHFPGDPIVPGVVLLEYVQAMLRCWRPDHDVTGLARAKFLSPLEPDTPFSINLTQKDKDTINFECLLEARILAVGTWTVKKKT